MADWHVKWMVLANHWNSSFVSAKCHPRLLQTHPRLLHLRVMRLQLCFLNIKPNLFTWNILGTVSENKWI